MMNIIDTIRLMRPQQWLKNIFVFLPLFFGRHITDIAAFFQSVIAFFAFSLAASAIYCLNDLKDVEADKQHPTKYKRPIASGAVSTTTAWVLCVTCAVAALGISMLATHSFELLGLTLVYLLLNLAYCLRLKQTAIIDVFIISTGFVLRLMAGGVCSGTVLSQWIVLMTFLLALFLAFAKRRDDVLIHQNTGVLPRKNVVRYNLAFINLVITILATITMVCYIMYTVSEDVIARVGSPNLYLTSIFVLAGIIRYLQLTIVDEKSGSPTKVLARDRFIHACIAGWVLCFVVILYL